MTAEELMSQLEADPEYRRGLEEKERERQRRAKVSKRKSRLLLKALAKVGARVESIDDLVAQHAPLSREIIDVLHHFLPKVGDHALEQAIVRSIGATRVRYDGRALAAHFDSSTDSSLKWAIGNTFSVSKPQGIEDWVLGALRKREHGRARQMLCIAAARLAPTDETRETLLDVFEEMPGHAAMGLGLIGGPREAAFLQSRITGQKTWVRKEIEKAIRRIERRESE